MTNFEKLQAACEQFGKRGLAKRINISEAALYLALREKRGLRPDYMDNIEQLLHQNTANDSSAPIESNVSAERQLIHSWLRELSRDELTRVIAFIADIREKRKAEEPKM